MPNLTRAKSTYLNASAQARQTVAYTGLGDSSPFMDRAAALSPGEIVEGRYRIEEELGEGGMASVYRGRHIEIGAEVAIKVLHPRLLSIQGAAEGFLLEARALSRIRHRNVVSVSDFGRIGGRTPFMVMESLQGEDLFELVAREGALSWTRARALALQLCEGLAAVHATGIIHRDVKPENCFLVDDGEDHDFVKLIDFGVAKAIGGLAKVETERGLVKVPLQSSGTLAGTPDFMAPEEIYERALDHRVDVYSLGATLFVLLTGHTLFEGSASADETLLHHALTPPPAPSTYRPELPPSIDALLARALAKDPDDRFADMLAFARAIESIPGDPRVSPEERTIIHDAPIAEIATAAKPTDPAEESRVLDRSRFEDSLPSSLLLYRRRSPWRGVAAVTAVVALAVAGVVTFAGASPVRDPWLARLGVSSWSSAPALLAKQIHIPGELLQASSAPRHIEEPALSSATMLAMPTSTLGFVDALGFAAPSTENDREGVDPLADADPPEEPSSEFQNPSTPSTKESRTRPRASRRARSAKELPTISPAEKARPSATTNPFLNVELDPKAKGQLESDSVPSRPVPSGPLKNPYAAG